MRKRYWRWAFPLGAILGGAAGTCARVPETNCEQYVQAAQAGDAKTQTRLAACLDKAAWHGNLNRAFSDRSALKWYRAAASQGEPAAEFHLGLEYYHRRDFLRSRDWFLKAAKHGDLKAYAQLGSLYEQEGAVRAVLSQDRSKALEYYRQGAVLGDGGCQFELGLHYESGAGIDKDPTKARQWFEKAAGTGDCSAVFHLLMEAKEKASDKEVEKWKQRGDELQCRFAVPA